MVGWKPPRIPKGQGIWPAFWMLGNDIFTTNPWPASGEIDIMENIGKGRQTRLRNHPRSRILRRQRHRPTYDVTPTVADDFHVYAIEWEPTAIRWYLDGFNYFTATDR